MLLLIFIVWGINLLVFFAWLENSYEKYEWSSLFHLMIHNYKVYKGYQRVRRYPWSVVKLTAEKYIHTRTFPNIIYAYQGLYGIWFYKLGINTLFMTIDLEDYPILLKKIWSR